MTPLFLLTTLAVLMTASSASNCPQKCFCLAMSVSCHGMTDFDKNFPSSKEQIRFWGSNINVIPRGIFSNVGQERFDSSKRSIHFYSTNIGIIEEEAFNNLQNFESILFTNVNISRIKEGSFKNLKNLRSFSFLESNIGIIDQNAFVNFLNISDFRISNTKIDSILDNAFYDFQNISKFEISLAEIKTIESNSFSSFQGISLFELSWNRFESIGCSLLIQVALATNYLKFTHNRFPCDCNLYWLMETLQLSSLEDVNYCTNAGGSIVYLSQISGGKNSVLGECSPCHSVTHTSLSLSVIISTTDLALNRSALNESITTGGLHADFDTTSTGGLHADYDTTSTEPRTSTLFANMNISNTLLASSKLEKITTTTTTITKHSETSENQSPNAICSGTCLSNSWTSIYNTESTTNFINAAKDVAPETKSVIDINNSTMKISSEMTLRGFPTSSTTSLATILPSRLSTTFLSTRSSIDLPPTSSPTSSSTTRSPISSWTTSYPTSLPAKPTAIFSVYPDKFWTTGHNNEFRLYNGTLSKVSSTSSKTASTLSSTTFRATSSQSAPLSTKTELVIATTKTTNVLVPSSSSKSNLVTVSLSSSVESSTKPLSTTRNVKIFSSIAATRPAFNTSSSTDTVYPKIAFPFWTDATRVSRKTTEVTSEPIRGRTSRTLVNGALPVTISAILAFTLHFILI